eukprot:5352379-Amphidinium_carterae.1
MNALAAELGIRVEAFGFQFELEHFRGHLNHAADALSRLAEGASVPAWLSGVAQARLPERSFNWFRAWPPNLQL